jgi:hypothetical protein
MEVLTVAAHITVGYISGFPSASWAIAPSSSRRGGRKQQIRVGDNSKYFINRKATPPQSEQLCWD